MAHILVVFSFVLFVGLLILRCTLLFGLRPPSCNKRQFSSVLLRYKWRKKLKGVLTQIRLENGRYTGRGDGDDAGQ